MTGLGEMSGGIPGMDSTMAVDPRTGRPKASDAGKLMATGALAGAAAGAAIGSVVPIYGTIIGAGVGAVVGAVPGIMQMVKAKEGGSTKVERANKFATAIAQAEQSNMPTAVAAIHAADAEIRRYQGLAERASATSSAMVASAVAAAVPPNQALSAAGNALVEDVNAYATGKQGINPWAVRDPALLGLQEIPAGVAATNAALGPAQQANSQLEAALAAGGA